MRLFKFLGFSSSWQYHDISFNQTTYVPPRSFQPSRPTTTVQHLPLELALNIIEAGYYNDTLEPNSYFLRNCALVCKGWYSLAQRLLFRHVKLRTQADVDAFHYALNRSPRGCMLKNAVVRLRVILDVNHPSGISHCAFARVVASCPNLYELNVALYGCGGPGEDILSVPDIRRMRQLASGFDEEALSILKSGPRISALRFSNWSANHQYLNQLLEVWPTITTLAISGTVPHIPSLPLESLCKLEELHVNCQKPVCIEFMKWLLHNSTNSLRIVDLEIQPSPQMLDFLVGAHGHQLESLALPAHSPELVSAVQRCPQLKELKIESPYVSPIVYSKLPQIMQHIALGVDKNTVLKPVIDVINASEELKVVTVHLWNGGRDHAQLPALQVACAYKGVSLRMTHDIRQFRTLIRGDPVPSKIYPRTISLGNLQRMCYGR